MKKNETKKTGTKKMIIIVILLILLAIIIAIVSIGSSLMLKYNNTSYEYVPPIERKSEYILPDYPEVIIDTDCILQKDVEETIIDYPESVDSVDVIEENIEPTEITVDFIEPAETTAIEYTQDTTKSTETPDITYKPAETIAPVINTALQETTTYTQPSNPDASFANSINTVSVYGKVPIYKVEQKDSDIKNILLMGTDSRDVTLDRGRSDTMIVISYNSKDGSVKLTSLLRDSLVPIEGYGWNRINTAYFFGGVGLAINTVNQLYALDIQDFIVIDLNGAEDFIDYIGGVDITLTEEEANLYSTYTGTRISAGVNHFYSNLALTHMRNRAIGNDFGRTQRQRDTVTAIIKQVLTQKSVTEIYDIVDYSFSLIKTNISATDLVSLAASVLSNASAISIKSQNVPYSDAYQFAWYNGMSIISYDISDASRRINEFIYTN